jgi:formylglycine-generating enzyme required for sulfatase activity
MPNATVQSTEFQNIISGQELQQKSPPVQQVPFQQQTEQPGQQQEKIPKVEKLPSKIMGKDGVPMVLVPAGEFTMGAQDDDKEAQADERPAHPVYLDAFYIDQYEVTTSRYSKFSQETKRDSPQYWSETVPNTHGKKPVVGVTWMDGNAYCSWVGKRLPTEAEWEKAARGTDNRIYPWGSKKPNGAKANFKRGTDFKGYFILTDVGSFEGGKSPYGAYDMAGNVWEWVSDWYGENLYNNRDNLKGELLRNPKGPAMGQFRVLRGGSWANEARNLRTTNRSKDNPSFKYGNVGYGFRCAQNANKGQSFIQDVSPSAQQSPATPQTSEGSQTELNPEIPAEPTTPQPFLKEIPNPSNSEMSQQASKLLPQQDLKAPLQQTTAQQAQLQEVPKEFQQQQAPQQAPQLEGVQQNKEPPAQVEEPNPRITGKDGAVMVVVPAGEFTMGARDDDKEADSDERPTHQVYLDVFYLDQFEVTTSLYGKFFQETKLNPPQYWSETVPKKHGNKPVVGVTWEDANAYCVWAGKRLPTEAEWEKAARGTDQRLYPWGNDPPNENLANFEKCCEFNEYGVLTDVGSFEGGRSPYGVYDMAGNVWEWVEDWHDPEIYKKRVKVKKGPLLNPRGPEKGESRVLRGGSWNDGAGGLRSTDRIGANPTGRYGYYGGFRCAFGAP